MKISTAFLSVLFLASASMAQIQITQSSYVSIGQEFGFHSTEAELAVNVGSPGANQTWDFTGFNLDIYGTFAVVDPATTPYSGTFPGATLCCHTTTEGIEYGTHSYQRVAADGSYYLGMVIGQPGGEIITELENEVRQYPFPLAYSTPNWTYVNRWTIEIAPGIEMVSSDSVINDVDAWGTVNTAYGSYPTLRNFEHRWTTTTIPPLPPSTTESVGYTWLTAQGAGAVAIDAPAGVTNPNFTTGHVAVLSSTVDVDEPRGPVAGNFEVGQNYPNPFNPTTTLPITLEQNGKVEITIYNEIGQVVSRDEFFFGPGAHEIPFDGSAWASGAYYANVRTAHGQQTTKMRLVK